jgi:hypothetical protein
MEDRVMLTSQILLWTAVIVEGLLIAALAARWACCTNALPGRRPDPAPECGLGGKSHADDPGRYRWRSGGDRRQARGPQPAPVLRFARMPDVQIAAAVVRSGAGRAGWLDLVVAGDGSKAAYRAMAREHGLDGLPLVLSEALGRAFGVAKLPYAVLLDEEGRVASLGLVNSREHGKPVQRRSGAWPIQIPRPPPEEA